MRKLNRNQDGRTAMSASGKLTQAEIEELVPQVFRSIRWAMEDFTLSDAFCIGVTARVLWNECDHWFLPLRNLLMAAAYACVGSTGGRDFLAGWFHKLPQTASQ